MTDDPPLGAWLEHAACAVLDEVTAAIFTADRPTADELDEAESVCWRCPVRQDCADYAASAAVYGMWAGVWRSPQSTSREEIAA